MKFASWTYDGFQVDKISFTSAVSMRLKLESSQLNLLNSETNADLSNYVQNGEWDLVFLS